MSSIGERNKEIAFGIPSVHVDYLDIFFLFVEYHKVLKSQTESCFENLDKIVKGRKIHSTLNRFAGNAMKQGNLNV